MHGFKLLRSLNCEFNKDIRIPVQMWNGGLKDYSAL